MTIRYAARTDLGMRRTHNEDCYGILEEERLILVADGMGGHAAGEIASGLATIELGTFYHQTHVKPDRVWPFARQASLSELANRLVCGIKVANERIFEMASSDKGRKGMGTTLVAAAILGDEICIAHVGDSRAYRIHDSAIERLTRDHSLLEQFKELYPEMTAAEEENFPHKNVITRALGLGSEVEIDVQTHTLVPGDRYLLCSDGLSGHLTDNEILETMRGTDDLQRAVAELVDRANELGGHDNITIVALAVGTPDPTTTGTIR
jgi:serine/threonine protein phosphatase PrpC